jgi:hypothetical protein
MRTSAGSGTAARGDDFRPASYFWPLGLETHLLARVKGAARKKALRKLIAAGEIDRLPEFLTQSELSEEDRRMIGRVHPQLMGGEYLPRLADDEVEIARIAIRSTTGDVTAVYARRGAGGTVHYRVVDEYDGETLQGETTRALPRTLTLGELVDFFLGAWSLVECCRANFEDDLEGALGFFSGESAFYEDFDEALRDRLFAACAEDEPDSR